MMNRIGAVVFTGLLATVALVFIWMKNRKKDSDDSHSNSEIPTELEMNPKSTDLNLMENSSDLNSVEHRSNILSEIESSDHILLGNAIEDKRNELVHNWITSYSEEKPSRGRNSHSENCSGNSSCEPGEMDVNRSQQRQRMSDSECGAGHNKSEPHCVCGVDSPSVGEVVCPRQIVLKADAVRKELQIDSRSDSGDSGFQQKHTIDIDSDVVSGSSNATCSKGSMELTLSQDPPSTPENEQSSLGSPFKGTEEHLLHTVDEECYPVVEEVVSLSNAQPNFSGASLSAVETDDVIDPPCEEDIPDSLNPLGVDVGAESCDKNWGEALRKASREETIRNEDSAETEGAQENTPDDTDDKSSERGFTMDDMVKSCLPLDSPNPSGSLPDSTSEPLVAASQEDEQEEKSDAKSDTVCESDLESVKETAEDIPEEQTEDASTVEAENEGAAGDLSDDCVQYTMGPNGEAIALPVHYVDAEDWPSEMLAEQPSRVRGSWEVEMMPREGEIIFTRNVLKRYCGFIFGKGGKNAKDLRGRLNCRMQLEEIPYSDSHLLHFVCPEENTEDVDAWFLKKVRYCRNNDNRSNWTVVSRPEQMLRTLPLGKIQPVMVIGMTSPVDLFVRNLADDSAGEFQGFQASVHYHYVTHDCPRLPTPVSPGLICVALYIDNFYYRARIIDIVPFPNGQVMAIVFFLDFGGFMWQPVDELLKIKAEFLDFPFQAILVRWAHAESLQMLSVEEIYARYLANRVVYAFAVNDLSHSVSDVVLFTQPGAYYYETEPDPRTLQDVLWSAQQEGTYSVVPYNGAELVEGNPYVSPPRAQIDYAALLGIDLEAQEVDSQSSGVLLKCDNCGVVDVRERSVGCDHCGGVEHSERSRHQRRAGNGGYQNRVDNRPFRHRRGLTGEQQRTGSRSQQPHHSSDTSGQVSGQKDVNGAGRRSNSPNTSQMNGQSACNGFQGNDNGLQQQSVGVGKGQPVRSVCDNGESQCRPGEVSKSNCATGTGRGQPVVAGSANVGRGRANRRRIGGGRGKR